MKASILDLRRKMSDILRALDRNESVTILYRGKERAVLSPLTPVGRQAVSVFGHPAYGMWRNRDDLRDVAGFVDEARKGRTHAV